MQLEFSERAGALDGESSAGCEHFVMAVRTWSSENVCASASDALAEYTSLTTSPDGEAQTSTFKMSKKT